MKSKIDWSDKQQLKTTINMFNLLHILLESKAALNIIVECETALDEDFCRECDNHKDDRNCYNGCSRYDRCHDYDCYRDDYED